MMDETKRDIMETPTVIKVIVFLKLYITQTVVTRSAKTPLGVICNFVNYENGKVDRISL